MLTLRYLTLLVSCQIILTISQDSFAQVEHHLDLKIQPTEIGDKISAILLERGFGWRYQKVCSYYGALIYADASNKKALAKKIENGYSPYLSGKRKPKEGHVDYNVFGIWPFELYRQTGNKAYLEMGKFMADDEYASPREDGLTEYSRFWVDDMYMVASLQVQAYRSLKDQLYLDRAALLLVAYLDSLQKDNGLFYHRADAPHYWGRGNGWAAAAMAEILQELPKNHKHYPALVNGYKKMMAALLEVQGEDGMWHQLLDKHDSFREPSCTGMFLFAFVTGVDLGILPEEKYLSAIEKAWNTLAGEFVNKKGEVIKVCMWTNAKKTNRLLYPKAQNYRRLPRTSSRALGNDCHD